ncbi:MAG: hypothetical protein RL318_1564 [Fibrobacterota bacterium]|jgi:hypothetical protein
MTELHTGPKAQETSAPAIVLTRASFLGTKGGAIRRLSGWRSNHSVPKEVNSYTRSFVQRLSEEELKERLEHFHTAIKEAFGYKRKQMEGSRGGGFASCKTPDFDLELSIAIDPQDPSRYVETVSVTGIRNFEILTSDAFGEIFDGQFTEVLFEYSQPFDVETVIDTLEDRDDPTLKLTYPPDASRCTIDLTREGVRIVFSSEGMRFEFDGKPGMAQLSQILAKGHRLMGTPGGTLLPPPWTNTGASPPP